MRLGYIRERKAGPIVDEQRKALAAAGVPSEGDHPPIYIDMIPRRTRKALDNPLPERAAAIHSLRPGDGDALVVFDAATIGQTEGDILDALAAIGERDATLIVCNPPGEYRWHPDAAECAGLAVDGRKILDKERRRVRVDSGPIIGRPPLLTGDALALARDLWGKRELNSKMVAAEIKVQTGIAVSVRTLLHKLGHKADAVEAAERQLRRPKPSPALQKQKVKAKRRKLATRKVKESV